MAVNKNALIAVLGVLLVIVFGLYLSEVGEPPPPAPAAAQPKSKEQQVAAFRYLWATTPKGMMTNRWWGVATLQHPFDVWVTQEILTEVKPDFVIEAGTYRGGSAPLWAAILEQINPDARVITIDIEDQRTPEAVELEIAKRKVDFLLGSSTDPELVDEIRTRVAGRSAVVILDSLHTKKHVLDELRAYADMVPVGSYLIVQDTAANQGQAVREFLLEDDRFEIDKGRERLLLTNNRDGYLKRIR